MGRSEEERAAAFHSISFLSLHAIEITFYFLLTLRTTIDKGKIAIGF
jgi:hypothetical protein